MKRIERGISLEFRKENELVIKPVKFFLIAGIFDKPAKSSILIRCLIMVLVVALNACN